MNINSQAHFAVNPTNLDIKRSTFDRSSGHSTTFNAGELVPIYVDEVLPGDTFKMGTSYVARMNTPIHPTMGNAYIDTYFFFVPSRLVWKHWNEFNGENTTTAWEQTTEYQIPQLKSPKGGWNKGTIADYFGIPINVDLEINALPIKAYTRIWNDWFRDQNVQDPAYLDIDDTTIEGSNGGTYQTDAQKGGKCLPVNKYHDYFTSCLPEPQKGPSVLLPLGNSAPIIGNSPIKFIGAGEPNTDIRLINTASNIQPQTGNALWLFNSGTEALSANRELKYKDGLSVDLTNATAATINELRQAFQLQRLYERDARGGTRYIEIIKSHFGVTSPDQRQQRPEYLGGSHKMIDVMQVLQTSSTDETSPQGNTAAFSYTKQVDNQWIKSFTEHGYIIGLACVRTEHVYQQGLERMWSRKRRFDFYWPALANIGEQAVLNKEIYAQGNAKDNEVFGYQEAWAEYRYKPSRVSGALRSTYEKTLDVWHYADKYDSLPMLNDTWMRENKNNIDRTLAVQSSVEDQFVADFYFEVESTRPLPMYSIPGMLDHN